MFGWYTGKGKITGSYTKICIVFLSIWLAANVSGPAFAESQCFGILTTDRADALQVCEEECVNGDASSCYSLGVLLIADSGASSRMDSLSAFRRGCDLGNCRSCVAINEVITHPLLRGLLISESMREWIEIPLNG